MRQSILIPVLCALNGFAGILFSQNIGTTVQSYPQPGVFIGSEMVEAANGDLLVCGILGPKGLLARLDPCGILLWQKEYQFGNDPTGFRDLVETPSGDIVVVGYCKGYQSTTRQQGLILKTSSTGTVLPNFPKFPFQQDSLIAAIDLVPQDSGFVIGSTVDIPWFHESFASRLNSQMDSLWRVECDGFGNATFIYDLDVDPSGIYLTGMTEIPFGENRIPAWKLDHSGNQQWYRELSPDIIPGTGSRGYSIKKGFGNDLWVGGSVRSVAPDSSDPGLFKLTSDSGQTASFWAPQLSGFDEVRRIYPLPGYCLVGRAFGSEAPFGTSINGKISVMVFDSTASPVSTWYYPTAPSNDPTWMIAGLCGNGVDTSTWKWFGFPYGYPGQLAVGIREYVSLCPTVAVEEGKMPLNCRVYPNPIAAGEAIHVEMDQPFGLNAEITIHSLSGTRVYHHTVSDGNDSFSFSPGLSAGVYLLRVENQEGFWSTRLMVTE